MILNQQIYKSSQKIQKTGTKVIENAKSFSNKLYVYDTSFIEQILLQEEVVSSNFIMIHGRAVLKKGRAHVVASNFAVDSCSSHFNAYSINFSPAPLLHNAFLNQTTTSPSQLRTEGRVVHLRAREGEKEGWCLRLQEALGTCLCDRQPGNQQS